MLLRYLSDAYKALIQSVPVRAKTEAVRDIEAYLGAIVRGTDASLLEEWERLTRGSRSEAPLAERDALAIEAARDLTKDVQNFEVLVRNECFRFVKAFATRRFDAIAEIVEGTEPRWNVRTLEQAMAPYIDAHALIRTDAIARGREAYTVDKAEDAWSITQALVDDEGITDWALFFRLDLAQSRERGRPALSLMRVGT